MQTRVLETGSGSFGPNGGGATMQTWCDLVRMTSEARIASNEMELSHRSGSEAPLQLKIH